MSLTAFPNGISSFGVPVMGGVFPFTGTYFFVKPVSGLDGNDGLSPQTALKTVAAALAKCTANKNDVVFFISEGNSSANATDYQSATLAWNKDHTHLIGINAGPQLSQRSRIGFISTYVTASNLFTLSANGCYVANMSFYAGVADVNPTGCMKITGARNHFANCHIAGIGADEMDTAGAYDLWMYDSSENLFEDCVIGIDTISRGSAANAGLLFTGAGVGSARNIFRRCIFPAWCMSAGNYVFLKANGVNYLDRWLLFDNCIFHNTGTSVATGVQMTQAFQIHANANGHVILHNTTIIGADNVNTADTGLILVGSGGLAANTEATDLGLAVVTTNA